MSSSEPIAVFRVSRFGASVLLGPLLACSPDVGDSNLQIMTSTSSEIPVNQFPGNPPQDFLVVACADSSCTAGRHVGEAVHFAGLDLSGGVLGEVPASSPTQGWNHPELVRYQDGYLSVSATDTAPALLVHDVQGRPISDPLLLAPAWPRGQWPDLALGEDGRAMVVWSTKVDGLWAVVDPEAGHGIEGAPWERQNAFRTIDPPAVAAVPGGYVRAWTEKSDVGWALWLVWTDLDGRVQTDPQLVAEGPDPSRGARPQLAACADGSVALAWRELETRLSPPQGAWLQIFHDTEPGPIARLDTAQGNRPTVACALDGWLVAWEEPDDRGTQIWIQSRDPDGGPASEAVRASDQPGAQRVDLGLRESNGVDGLMTWEHVPPESSDPTQEVTGHVRPIPELTGTL